MKLTRTIPVRKKTVEFIWIRKNFMIMGDMYRTARSTLRKPMDSCWWCGHRFEDGEAFALGCIRGTGNKVLCHDCADEAGATNE